MSQIARRWCLIALIGVCLPACDSIQALLGGEPPAPQNAPYPIEITVVADGQPLAGAVVQLGTRPVGTSNASGSLKLSLSGVEGDVVDLTVKCPEGFVSPDKPVSVRMQRFAAGSPPPRFPAQCMPLVRSFVIGVRAENGPNLPIKRLNQVVAKTDSFGVAHFLMRVAPNEQVVLTLDTADAASLRPESPTLTFVAPDHDLLVLLEQRFTSYKPKVKVKPRPRPQPL